MELLILIYACADLTLALIISLSNLVVISVYVRSRHVRTPTNAYIFSLAITDFLAGALGIPATVFSVLTREPRQFLPCLAVHLCLCMLCTISTFHLLAIAIDKYLTICCKRCQLFDQHHSSRHMRSKTLIALAWVLGSAVASLPLFNAFNFASNTRPSFQNECHFTKVVDYRYLVYVIFFATIIAPSVIIAYCYTAIYSKIRSEERQIKCLLRAAERQRRMNNRRKIIRILMILVLTYAFCWYPLYLLNTVDFYFPPDAWLHSTPLTTLAAVVLSHLNCALNPVIYAYGVPGFKHSLRRFLPFSDHITVARTGSGYRQYYICDTADGAIQPHYSHSQQHCNNNNNYYKYSITNSCRNNLLPNKDRRFSNTMANSNINTYPYNRQRVDHNHNDNPYRNGGSHYHNNIHNNRRLPDYGRRCGGVAKKTGQTCYKIADKHEELDADDTQNLTQILNSSGRDPSEYLLAIEWMPSDTVALLDTDEVISQKIALPKLISLPSDTTEISAQLAKAMLRQHGHIVKSMPKTDHKSKLIQMHRNAKSLDETTQKLESGNEINDDLKQKDIADYHDKVCHSPRGSLPYPHKNNDDQQLALSESRRRAGGTARKYLLQPIRDLLARSGHRQSDSGVLQYRRGISKAIAENGPTRKSAIEMNLQGEYPILVSRLTNAEVCRCISSSTTSSSTSSGEGCSGLSPCANCLRKSRNCEYSENSLYLKQQAHEKSFKKNTVFEPLRIHSAKKGKTRRRRLSSKFNEVKTQLKVLGLIHTHATPDELDAKYVRNKFFNVDPSEIGKSEPLAVPAGSTPVFSYLTREAPQILDPRRNATQPEIFPGGSKPVLRTTVMSRLSSAKFHSQSVIKQGSGNTETKLNSRQKERPLFDLLSEDSDEDSESAHVGRLALSLEKNYARRRHNLSNDGLIKPTPTPRNSLEFQKMMKNRCVEHNQNDGRKIKTILTIPLEDCKRNELIKTPLADIHETVVGIQT